jgi:hypothetical protein
MSLSRKIAAALADRGAAGPSPGPLEISEGPHRLSLSVHSTGSIGVEAEAIDFFAEGPERPLDALRAWADRLAARVTYLMEPLVVLEADALGGEVELRSGRPTPREGTRAFYEARIDRSGHLRITRQAYRAAERRREAVPFQLTREVLERLADDLAATAG